MENQVFTYPPCIVTPGQPVEPATFADFFPRFERDNPEIEPTEVPGWSLYFDGIFDRWFRRGDTHVKCSSAAPHLIVDERTDEQRFNDEAAYHAAQRALREASRNSFATPWFAFDVKEIPEPRALISSGPATLIRSGSLNEVFAYRGIGKSALIASFIGLLLNGGDFLGFRSDGNYRVLLVDGELPEIDLQTRIREFAKPGRRGQLFLRYDGMGDKPLTKLNTPEAQERFLADVKALNPDVIIFDTRTAIFGYDTNDTTATQNVNTFLTSLRRAGFAVILTHHAGKNGTQRGRTDGDDPLDLIIKLSPREGWKPGDGLQFKLDYEKVRRGDSLKSLEAQYSNGKWTNVKNDFYEKVLALLYEGKGVATIAAELSTSEYRVKLQKRIADERGIALPGAKPGRKAHQ